MEFDILLNFSKNNNDIYSILQLRDNSDLERQKLLKDLELADIQLETARADLATKHSL